MSLRDALANLLTLDGKTRKPEIWDLTRGLADWVIAINDGFIKTKLPIMSSVINVMSQIKSSEPKVSPLTLPCFALQVSRSPPLQPPKRKTYLVARRISPLLQVYFIGNFVPSYFIFLPSIYRFSISSPRRRHSPLKCHGAAHRQRTTQRQARP